MRCRLPRPVKSSSTGSPRSLVTGQSNGYRKPDLENRDATVAVIGAGDFIGAAIAKKFASEGFAVFAGRRHGDKLAPLVAEVGGGGRADRWPVHRCPQGGGGYGVLAGSRCGGPARSLHF